MPITLDAAQVAQVAAQHNVPPAILAALAEHGDTGGRAGMGLNAAQLTALGLDPADVSSDPNAQLQGAAQLLDQYFRQTGTWEGALSVYFGGAADAYQSPTGTVAGDVFSVLAMAGQDPTAGTQGFTPSDVQQFTAAADAFGHSLSQLSDSGGVVTQGSARQWMSWANEATGGRLAASQGSGTWYQPSLGDGLQAAAKNTGNDYSYGECTYYVARSLGWVPGHLGDGGDWAVNAARQGFSVTEKPTVGSVVVYGRGGGYSSQYGHVAVVTGVNPNGTFTVSEMNVSGWNQTDTRVSSMGDVVGFIQPPSGAAAPQAVGALHQTMRTASRGGQPSAPRPPGPDPSAVSQMADQLQGAGIDPEEFAASFPHYAAQRRRLLQENSSVADFAEARAAIMAENGGVAPTQSQILDYLARQPHPIHGVPAGAMADMYGTASLYTLPMLGRTPYPTEVARFVNSKADMKDVQGYYQQVVKYAGEQNQPPRGLGSQAAQQPSVPDNETASQPSPQQARGARVQ